MSCLAAASIATVGLAGVAAPAHASNPSCAGSSYSTSLNYRYCDVAAGESIQYTIKGGNGGNGNLVSGSGGAGAKIVGTFTNTSGGTVVLEFYVGATGANGGSSTSGANGQLSSIGVQGAQAFVVAEGGGGGGANGSAGSSGVGSSTLPSGAAFVSTTNVEASSAVFTAMSAPDGSPTAVPQGLPMPSSGLCADVKDAAFAWGTGLTGGWTKAWEPWVNPDGGKGGWACTRTLVYVDGSWAIQA
jgi:hypothetical protein